jgi:hypothetical protein
VLVGDLKSDFDILGLIVTIEFGFFFSYTWRFHC